jgi:NitT/TauT family transport system permease protein
MNIKKERWSPWMLLVAMLAAVADHLLGLQRLGVHLPQPGPHRHQFIEFRGPHCRPRLAHLLGHDGGFGIAIVVGVLLGFLIGSSRLAYAAVYPLMTGFNALPKAAFVPILVVWFGIGVGPAILTAFLISSSRSW